jgi:hypothetical protein
VFRRVKREHVRKLAGGITGNSRHTLKMAASVSRHVQPDVRVDALTWWHHVLVASFEPAQQTTWLTHAAERSWSANQLRERLREAGLVARRPGPARARRLISDVVKLRSEEVPGDLVAELDRWWRGILQAIGPALDEPPQP